MRAPIGGLALLAIFTSLIPVPAAAADATPLTDAELDAVSAQGLIVVSTSFGFARIADRFAFRFTAHTTIRTADAVDGRAAGHVEVAFLEGTIVSVTARNAIVHTQASLVVSSSDPVRSAARAALMRHIPRALAGR